MVLKTKKEKNKKIFLFALVATLILLLVLYFLTRSGEPPPVLEKPRESSPDFDKHVTQTPTPRGKITPADFREFPESDSNPPPDLFSDISLTTPVPAMLFGKVTGEDGEPLPETCVSVFSHAAFWSIPNLIRDRSTDEEGRYRFSDLPVESVCVVAKRKGYFLEMAKVDFSRDSLSFRKDFILRRGGFSLTGVVKNEDNEKVEGAVILVYLPEPHFHMKELSRKDGTFRFEGFPESPVALSVSAPGYMVWNRPSVLPGREPIEVILEKGGTRLKGNVTMKVSQEPVRSAFVKVAGTFSQTDESGYYETTFLPPGTYGIYVIRRFTGNMKDPVERIDIEKNGPEEVRLDLAVDDIFNIKGRVVDDQDGSPIQGALVQGNQSSWKDYLYITVDSSSSHLVKTDARGIFCLEACPSRYMYTEKMMFTVSAGGYHDKNVIIPVPDRIDAAPVEIRLSKGICVAGTVSDSGGAPVPRARLTFRNKEIRSMKDKTFSDEDGCYSKCFSTFTGTSGVILTAYDPAKGFAVDDITFSDKAGEFRRDLVLEPGVCVRVMVKDERGRGMKDIRIKAETARGKDPFFEHVLYTDADGAALFTNLPRLPMKFTAISKVLRFFHQKELDLTNVFERQELVFKLDEGDLMVFGFVTDEKEKPLKDVVISSYLYGTGKIKSDEDGYYQILLDTRGVQDQTGRISIGFSLQGYQTKYVRVDREENSIPLDVTMKKKDSFLLFGHVRGRDGTIPSGVYFLVLRNNKGGFLPPIYTALSEDGYFEIEADTIYRKGCRYRIMARSPELGGGVSSTLAAGKRERLGPFEIILQKGTLEGSIRDADSGDPVQDALVSQLNVFYEDELDKVVSHTRTDDKGYYKLESLPFGKNEICISHPDYGKNVLVSPEITETKPWVEWNPVLSSMASVNGRIYDASGRPLPDIFVMCNFKGAKTDSNGWFNIRGLKAGDHKMTIDIALYKENCPAVIQYVRNVTLLEKEKKYIELRLPPRTPVHVVVKGVHFHLKALSPMDIDLFYIACDRPLLNKGIDIPLPIGRFLVQCDDKTIPDREVNFSPGGMNELKIVRP